MLEIKTTLDFASFGSKIRTLRIEKKLTQEELSVQIGVTRNFISKIETANAIPSLETVIKLAIALNVSLDYLFFETIKPTQESEKDIVIGHTLKSFSELDKDLLINLLNVIDDYTKKSNKI